MAKKKQVKKRCYTLVIAPAIKPAERHRIENALTRLGYKIAGGGTTADMSECDFSFEK